MNAKYRCVGYARISQKNKHARGADVDITKSEQSIEHQKNYIKTFCDSHPDYELIEIFQDTKSGTLAANRDGFQNALNYLNNGVAGCNALIVYQKDRLGRNAMEYIKLLWDTQSQNKYIFELTSTSSEPKCLTHNIDKSEKPNILTIVQDAMDAFAIESYLMGLSEKAIQLNKDKVLNKHKFYTGGNAKYGYKIVKEPELHYEIVEEEAEAIRIVYRLYVENKWGARKIVNYLNNHGYTFRSTKKVNDSNKHIFTYDNVQKILNCPEYATGQKIIWKRSSIVLRKQLQRDLLQAFPQYKSVNFISDEELDEFLRNYNGGTTRYNYVIDNVYPIIIDKETYEKYQQIKSKRGPAIKEPLDPNSTGWLSGIIYCECGEKMFCHGRRMTTYVRRNKTCPPVTYQTYNYYQCRSYIKGTITKPYGTPRCNAKKATVSYAIDEYVYRFVSDLIDGTSVQDTIAKAILQKKKAPISSDSKKVRIKNLQEIISTCNKKLGIIAERKAIGYYDNPEGFGPTKKTYQEEVNKVIAERDEAYATISKLNLETSKLDNKLNDYNSIVDEWKDFKENDKSGFLHSFLSKVQVYNQENGDVHLYLYFKIYEDIKVNGQNINPIRLVLKPKDLRKKPKPYVRYNKWVALKNKKESS